MRADATDAALETLLQPFADGLLDWPAQGQVLFLRARDGAALRRLQSPGLACEQEFKPAVDALQRAGYATVELDALPPMQRYALVLVLPPRQREEARALYAQALLRCAPGGRVLGAARNDEGARSSESDLAQLAGPLSNLSRRKCRAFWTAPVHELANPALVRDWAALDAPRAVLDGRYTSRPGVFAWDRIDPASALLAAHLPPSLSGHAADLGAGYGYLSAELLARCAGIRALDLYEAQSRALAMARINLRDARVPLQFLWHDVAAGLTQRYDVIVSNPPFHAQGGDERPDIGRRFIAQAARSLHVEGGLWMVANRHLPYENALHEHFAEVRNVAQQDGFKVIEARQPRMHA